MSVQVVGSPFWIQAFDEIEYSCFLCGETFKLNEKVIHWMGCGGPVLTSIPKELLDKMGTTPVGLFTADTLIKRGLAPANDIFFHPNCVPSFCRRVLEDWESVVGIKEDRSLIDKT